MRLGQVIGKLVMGRKVTSYDGGIFLVVQPISRAQMKGEPLLPLAKGSTLVVYDRLGAREGDIIGFSESGEAAAAFETPTPVDAYNTAIIDTLNYKPPK
jgi:microcompartment protein CcmK/EutM